MGNVNWTAIADADTVVLRLSLLSGQAVLVQS